MGGVVVWWRGRLWWGAGRFKEATGNPCAAKSERCGTSAMPSRCNIATTNVGAQFGPDMFISAPFQHQEVP